MTARLTPPNNPQNNPGYLEYGENEFADSQGEDSDDYIRFTAKAPAGRPFTGRMWVPPPNSASLPTSGAAISLFLAGYQPITITSEYAEIIYFLRNGNLYRRVLLVAPERQSTIVATVNNQATFPYSAGNATSPYMPSGLGGTLAVSWQGMNDLSAHPATGPDPTAAALNTHNSVVLNTLASLTNRENRWAYQRFANDFQSNLTGVAGPDNLADDFNGDNVPDYYPTLYSETVSSNPPNPPTSVSTNPNTLIFESPYPAAPSPLVPNYRYLMAFPYVFPGAYSRPQTLGAAPNYTTNYGWIHSPEPIVVDANGNPQQYDVAARAAPLPPEPEPQPDRPRG